MPGGCETTQNQSNKTSVKVHHPSGGQSQIILGDDYSKDNIQKEKNVPSVKVNQQAGGNSNLNLGDGNESSIPAKKFYHNQQSQETTLDNKKTNVKVNNPPGNLKRRQIKFYFWLT